ncbi:MAG TPA: hypothetical protein VJ932_12160 [Alkalispirochaeta sp.]|nr:hypothetical protein [Alkalispirochaeta sp.]
MEVLKVEPEFNIDEALAAKLNNISAATVDRLLKPERRKLNRPGFHGQEELSGSIYPISQRVEHFWHKAERACRIVDLVERSDEVKIIFGLVERERSGRTGMPDQVGRLCERAHPLWQVISPEPVAVLHRKEHRVPPLHLHEVMSGEKTTAKVSFEKGDRVLEGRDDRAVRRHAGERGSGL